MSGHSKWATIKHKKGAADAKRGKIFSRLAKEITIVVKHGGGDPGNNPSLRTLIQKAKGVNMPNDNIDRAVKKGTGELQAETYEEVSYEGYAAGGIGVVVKALTDNKNRAASEIRNIFKKNNSDFAALGAVSRNFERKGTILVAREGQDEDALMEVVLNAGADDMASDDDGFEITCSPAAYNDVCAALEKAGIPAVSSECGLKPTATTHVTDLVVAKAVTKFVSMLEDNDDVQDVYHNMDVDDSIADQLEG